MVCGCHDSSKPHVAVAYIASAILLKLARPPRGRLADGSGSAETGSSAEVRDGASVTRDGGSRVRDDAVPRSDGGRIRAGNGGIVSASLDATGRTGQRWGEVDAARRAGLRHRRHRLVPATERKCCPLVII